MATWRFIMNNLMKTEDREIRPARFSGNSDRIKEYRDRISDEAYLDHAITKIATDLSHYLTK
jgi:hypothetical protein